MYKIYYNKHFFCINVIKIFSAIIFFSACNKTLLKNKVFYENSKK